LVNAMDLEIGRRLRAGQNAGRTITQAKILVPYVLPAEAQAPVLGWLARVEAVVQLRHRYLYSAWFNVSLTSAEGTNEALVRNWISAKLAGRRRLRTSTSRSWSKLPKRP
jgi:hypothetical protein